MVKSFIFHTKSGRTSLTHSVVVVVPVVVVHISIVEIEVGRKTGIGAFSSGGKCRRIRFLYIIDSCITEVENPFNIKNALSDPLKTVSDSRTPLY